MKIEERFFTGVLKAQKRDDDPEEVDDQLDTSDDSTVDDPDDETRDDDEDDETVDDSDDDSGDSDSDDGGGDDDSDDGGDDSSDDPDDDEERDAATEETSTTDVTPTVTGKDPKVLKGYAIVFNQQSKDLGGFTEIIDPKALDGVDFSNVLMLNNHDYKQVLASVKADTLKLTVDDKGLAFEATLPDTSFANDVYEEVTSGNVDSCSFGFDVADGGDSFNKDDNGNSVRTIKQIKTLYDVSIVSVPAYDATSVDTRSYKNYLKMNGATNMTEKRVLQNADSETRSFENYIRSQGEERSGLTTEGNQAIIPSEVITPIFESKIGAYNLAQYVTQKTVNTGQGTYPIATNDPSVFLMTKAESAEYDDVEAGVTGVPFKVTTKAGRIYLSKELIQDNAVDLVSEVQSQMKKLVGNTNNHNIVELLKAIDVTPVTSIDEIKTAKNTKLDPALNLSVILNQDSFDYLDTLKDLQGDYLLTPDVTAPFGKKLFGYDVIVVSNAQMPSDKGTLPIFIGDFAETIAMFNRLEVTTKWEEFDLFSEGLAVTLRNDYELMNKNAALNLALTPAKATVAA